MLQTRAAVEGPRSPANGILANGASGGPRLRDPLELLPGIDRGLAAILAAAVANLPPGWSAEVTAGRHIVPPLGYVGSARRGPAQHGWGLAADLRLVDPKGRAIPAKSREQGGQAYEAYRQLADLAFAAQRELHPELTGRLAWGGKFTTADGQWDIGHFDLGGFRGRGVYRKPAVRPAAVRPAAFRPAASRL